MSELATDTKDETNYGLREGWCRGYRANKVGEHVLQYVADI